MTKKIISMNVEEKVYSKFVDYCKSEGIIMSKQVENFMKKFLKETSK